MPKKIELKKIPPLNSLKGFEATARLLSVRGAAKELNLTHPAISHQIQALEDNLNVKLFRREGRNITLTKEGKLFYPYAQKALEKLVEGVDVLSSTLTEHPIKIQSYITNSIRWLAPRLPKFTAEHPNIQLHLITSNSNWEFDEDHADIGLIFNDAAIPAHLSWTKLFNAVSFPVCSPDLIHKSLPLRNPLELLNYPLLSVYTEAWTWENWFDAATGGPVQITRSLQVDTLAMALEMAQKGEGIALVNGPAASDYLRTGQLVRPVDRQIKVNGEWGVICAKNIRNTPRIVAVIDWLQKEAALSNMSGFIKM